MRDLLGDIFDQQPADDPMTAARRTMQTPLRKRFYEIAGVGEEAGGWVVLLDGRPVRTPARRPLRAPSAQLAQALAAEWQAQGEWLDPVAMPLTRLANSIIDGVVDAPQPVAADVARYLGSDLIFYRAEGPEGLLVRQAEHWDPLMAWAREALGARFVLVEGVTFVSQPAEAVAAAVRAIPDDPWALGALHAATTLTGSPLIALALASARIDLEQAWRAAHVDEDWNMDAWGRDELVLERRRTGQREMAAAALILADRYSLRR